MKRKLDANDVPAPAEKVAELGEESTFASLGLDSRLLQGIAKQNFKTPTLVQSKAIPLALNGQDILARAKTGSGKTAAYLLPILHSILKRKQVGNRKIQSCVQTNVFRILLPNALLPLYSYLLENSQNKSSKLSKHSRPLPLKMSARSTSHKKSLMPSNDHSSQTFPML